MGSRGTRKEQGRTRPQDCPMTIHCYDDDTLLVIKLASGLGIMLAGFVLGYVHATWRAVRVMRATKQKWVNQ
jgi:hypothetical protein